MTNPDTHVIESLWSYVPTDNGLHGIGYNDARQIIQDCIDPHKLSHPYRHLTDMHAYAALAARQWGLDITDLTQMGQLKWYWHCYQAPLVQLLVSPVSLDVTQWVQPLYGSLTFLVDESGGITNIGVVCFTDAPFIKTTREAYEDARLHQ